MYFEVIVLLFLGARVFGVTELAKTSKTQIYPHILEFVEDPSNQMCSLSLTRLWFRKQQRLIIRSVPLTGSPHICSTSYDVTVEFAAKKYHLLRILKILLTQFAKNLLLS